MLEGYIIRHCAPTLAGLKTGSVFGVHFDDLQKLYSDIRDINLRLSQKGVRLIPISASDGRALIYVFRPNALAKDLSGMTASSILSQHGYDRGSGIGAFITTLSQRIKNGETFPHEIGLFLGYPPDDVKCFMDECIGCAKCKKVGCWKVYNDVDSAERSFARFKKCSRIYYEKWIKGTSLEKLTVNIA